ncbi:RHS repeat-associated core domain-containing protein [Myxococcus stipitatus]|uniref:RHS repeat-associated core domain-containing protein n=1 Tax=Myxococcus stipitatus TaxID=83455 RepID=UPI0030D5DE1C
MSTKTEQWLGWLGLNRGMVLLLACCLPWPVFAQLAPVMGTHYAAQASDTGFAGSTNAVGAYDASIPLSLPESRGGLPIPVQVMYGGNQVGAAGLGWDVPLSTIVRSKSLAYRRPKPGTFPAPDAPPSSAPLPLPESLTLTLGGGRTDLLLNAEGTAWVAREDAQLEVRASGESTLLVYDGNGLTYEFSAQGGGAGSRLDNGNLYLLRNITGMAGMVHLEYTFGAPALPGGGTGLSINLKSVVYNQSSVSPSCFKNKIQFNYDAPTTTPLSMSVLGSTVLARFQKLASISVDSRATCADAEVSLRRYDFTYQTDPDTQRPQLQKVTMVGQQGKPERNVTLPVATYSYGTLSDNDGVITYQKTQSIGVNDTSVFSHGLSFTTSRSTSSGTRELSTKQAFVDLDGDGRPEIKAGTSIYRNLPSSAVRGHSSFVNALFDLPRVGPEMSETISPAGEFESRYGIWDVSSSFSAYAKPVRTFVRTWKKHIDVNGDGRMDFIDATASFDYWLVLLNTPDPNDPRKSITIERRISLAAIRNALGDKWGGSYIPLEMNLTVATQGALQCFVLTEFEGWITPLVGLCPALETALVTRTQAAQATLALWELKDINGDGYPDFVYDVGPDVYNVSPVPAPVGDAPVGTFVVRQGAGVDLSSPRGVEVLYNSAGVHIEAGASGSLTFEAPTPLATGCGLGRWEAAPGDTSNATIYQTCGFEDVNGDGIVDRVTSALATDGRDVSTHAFVSSAALGTGNPDHPFADVKIELPAALSGVHTDMVTTAKGTSEPRGCDVSPTGSYNTLRTQALRDINGDGLPDYVSEYFGTWSVSFGTGTGFTPLKPLSVPTGLDLAREFSSCPGGDGIAGTDAGLYDLDGDGQPEIVEMNNIGKTLEVYQLKSPIQQFEIGSFASVPQAGRLIRIDNGYGMATRLSYQSAKVDASTHHNVPYPEIVVGAELTTDSASPQVLRAATVLHAHGNARMVFDSVQDRFVFPGYGRRVTMATTQPGSPPKGVATITDIYGLAPFAVGSDAEARFRRYLTTGRISDVTTVSGDIAGGDPWAFLTVNIANDSRRIRGTHYDWDARLLAPGQASGKKEACVEMMYPYDYTASLANALSPNDECVRRGFVFQKKVLSWQGTPGTSDPNVVSSTVRTRSSVEATDGLGRITQVRDENDLARANDDLCAQTTYATSVSTTPGPRMLNAPATRIVTNCANAPMILSRSTTEYDSLPVGQVSHGFVTAQIASRLDENGEPIPDAAGKSDIRRFDATYDAFGNIKTLTKVRDDGATRTETFSYDSFNLVRTGTATDASGGIPKLATAIEYDPVTLQVLGTTDPNGARTGSTYDGFGRVLQTLVTPSGGSQGSLSSLRYLGFAVGESGGRRVEQKVFTDPVDPATVATAAGRTGTTYFDELGRPTRTDVQLGADYSNKILVTGQRTYDLQGRVEFEVDPHPADESLSTAYGTTWAFNADGTPLCTIRGRGRQTLSLTGGVVFPSMATDEANEVYPTCFRHLFFSNVEVWEMRDAASSLAGSAQEKMITSSQFNAVGQLVRTSTQGLNSPVIDVTTFDYDALGRRTKLTRLQDPFSNSSPVSTTWHYDSLGQVVKLDEPGSAPQFRNYDTWNQLTQVQWTDTTTGSTIDKRTINNYDALGRLVHSEDQNNLVTILETVKELVYDQAFNNTTPQVTATNVLGRLAKATARTSSVFFSYDGLGRVNTQVFSDTTVSPVKVYVQKNQLHGDGSLQALHLLLPDRNFADERVDYGYDSAARPRAVTYTDGATSQSLFKAPMNGDVDVFGRVRQANFGLATFNAVFAETGRRLIQDLKITTPTLHSREISFAPVAGTGMTASFDPAGRERIRHEYIDGALTKDLVTIRNYDRKGRLALQDSFNPSTGARVNTYGVVVDPLGNLTDLGFTFDPFGFKTGQSDAGGVTLSYMAADLDRICSIAYGADTPAAVCNVEYDAVGNIMKMPSRSNGTRTSSYFPGGQVRQIAQGSSVATYDYDAFGAVQRLVLSSQTSSDTRQQDKYFGGMMAQRREGGVLANLRTIPVPGAVATRHGPTGNWTFAFAEGRGTRFVIDETGEFVQTVDYQPFGETKNPTGASPASTDYTREQWNGGDLLAAFGVNRLGARLYDPVIGRFLSRDPLFDDANGYNPYAFAANDPINNADPTGKILTETPDPWNPAPFAPSRRFGSNGCALCGLYFNGTSGGRGSRAEGLGFGKFTAVDGVWVNDAAMSTFDAYGETIYVSTRFVRRATESADFLDALLSQTEPSVAFGSGGGFGAVPSQGAFLLGGGATIWQWLFNGGPDTDSSDTDSSDTGPVRDPKVRDVCSWPEIACSLESKNSTPPVLKPNSPWRILLDATDLSPARERERAEQWEMEARRQYEKMFSTPQPCGLSCKDWSVGPPEPVDPRLLEYWELRKRLQRGGP